MSSPAKRRRERLARQRRIFQGQAADREAERERARQSWAEERMRMGWGVDLVAITPDNLKDITPRRGLSLPQAATEGEK